MKKTVSIITALAFLLVLASCAGGAQSADVSARVISILKNEGSHISLTKGAAREYEAQEGVNLYEGYTLATGAESYSYLEMDAASIVKVDQKSLLEVNRLNSKNLKLQVLSGAISVDAAPQKKDETLEVGAGNCALAVRGTLFVVEYNHVDDLKITMISGWGQVGNSDLKAGNSMNIINGEVREETLEPLVIDETLSLFMMETLQENSMQLVQEGVIKPDELDRLPQLISVKEKILEEEQKVEPVIQPEVVFATMDGSPTTDKTAETSHSSSSSSSSSSSLPAKRSSTPSSSSSSLPQESSPNQAPPSSSSNAPAAAHVNGTPYASLGEALLHTGSGDTMTLANNCTVQNGETLTLPAGATLNTGTYNLTLNGTLNVAGLLVNNGTLRNEGTLNLQDGQLQNNASFQSNGTITATGNRTLVQFSGGSSSSGTGLVNRFYINSLAVPASSLAGNTFVYNGTAFAQVVASATAGGATNYFGSPNEAIQWAASNSGSATLYKDYTLTSNTVATASLSSLEIAAGCTLTIPSGLSLINNTTTTVNGSVVVDGTLTNQNLLVVNGTLQNNGTLNCSNGSLENRGTLNTTNVFQFAVGNIYNYSAMNVSGNFTANAAGVIYHYGGTINFSSGIIDISSTIYPQVGGSPVISFGAGITLSGNSSNFYIGGTPAASINALVGNSFGPSGLDWAKI